MPDHPPVSLRRARGAYSRLLCLGCRERRIKCELPDDIVVPGSGELRTTAIPCYRCKKLGIPCVVRQTRLGRPGPGGGSTILPDTVHDETHPPARAANNLPQRRESYDLGWADVVLPTPRLDSLPPPASRCLPPKIQIILLRRATVPPTLSALSGDVSSSSDGRPIIAKRARASKPKVRTGCLTCKIRRIKCDEARPVCLKCSSTGRKCDGYSIPLPSKSSCSESPIDLARLPNPMRGPYLSPSKESHGEVRALEYFCVKTGPEMDFTGDFWNSFVVQASVAEPAIRHAMVALGILAEQRDVGNAGSIRGSPLANDELAVLSFPAQITETDPVALRSYNTSVGRLSQLASSPGTIDTVLLACILFVCIELLRGDAEAAIRHFNGGMAIIVDYISRPEGSRSSPLMLQRVRNRILPLFNRLEMLYALFGNDASWQYPITLSESIPYAFGSLGSARDSLVNLLNLSLRFVRTMDVCRYESSAIPALAFREQSALLDQLLFWHSRFSTYRAENGSEMTSKDLYACNVLEIQRLVAYTWVSVATTPFESSHDIHVSAYTTAISLAEQLPGFASSHAQSARYTRTFTLDVEIVGPIHWISIKCRDPAVRRRAIGVLRGMHRREGMWDSKIAVAIAERVVAIEETGLQLGELPSEEARVHYSFTNSWCGVTSADCSITHRMKPAGVYSDWFDRVEQFASH